MTISNKSNITGPILGWGVGLTSTNYNTCITLISTNLTQHNMNSFVLSGHESESFAAFLTGVILQKNNAAVITAAVITTHYESELRFR